MHTKALFLSFFLGPLLFTGCQNFSARLPVPANQVITYSLEAEKYVVVVVKDNDITTKQAEEEARRQAAQLTLDNGYRYFSILSTEEVDVVKSTRDEQSQMPKNLYQELIIEKNFTRNSDDYLSSTSLVPAVRLVIKCYREKPVIPKSYDATEWVG